MRRIAYSPTGTRRFLRLFGGLLALAAGGLAIVWSVWK